MENSINNQGYLNQEKASEWKICQEKDQIFIQSKKLLAYNFNHAFYTKTSSGKDPSTLINKFKQYSNYKIFQVNQVHGKDILKTSDNFSLKWPDADGIVTTKRNESLWIYSADCIPILFADKKTHIVGACHVGLSGIKKNIIKEMINKLTSLDSKICDMIIAMGPAISGHNYQVDKKDAKQAIKTIDQDEGSNDLKSKKNLNNEILNLPFLIKDNSENKVLLDIRLLAARQITSIGLSQKQIHINALCTFSNSNLFNSWRRDKKKQCQWSYINS